MSTVTNEIVGSSLGFSIPSDATINGIQVTFTRKVDSSISAFTYTVTLKKAGSNAGTAKGPGSAWTSTAANESWGSSSDLWGTTWTPADINNSGFGVGIVAQGTNSTSLAYNVYANNVSITVTYTPAASSAPTVSSVSPVSGVTGGGTSVTITGTDFTAGATVTFGASAATSVVVVNSTTITCVTPAHASGAVTVTVIQGTLSGSLANGFTYGSVPALPAPSISLASPSAGSTLGGDIVNLLGSNFYSNAVVKFNGVVATGATVLSSSQILLQTPASATAGLATVSVQNIDGQTATSNSVFTYVTPLVLSSISPSFGSSLGGQTVTLNGQGFLAGATVLFGTVPGYNVQVLSSTHISVNTPLSTTAFSGTVDVTVTNTNGQSSTLQGGFSFLSTPTITSVVPSTGPVAGGTTVIVNGTNFFPDTTVLFNGVSLVGLTYVSATQMQGVTPAGTRGYATIAVNSPELGSSGSAVSSDSYAYENGIWRKDLWLHQANGPSLVNAKVYVSQQPTNTFTQPPTNLAAIYSDPDGLVPIQQPMITDGLGHCFFYMPGRETGSATASDFVTITTFTSQGQLFRVSPDVFIGKSYF